MNHPVQGYQEFTAEVEKVEYVVFEELQHEFCSIPHIIILIQLGKTSQKAKVTRFFYNR